MTGEVKKWPVNMQAHLTGHWPLTGRYFELCSYCTKISTYIMLEITELMIVFYDRYLALYFWLINSTLRLYTVINVLFISMFVQGYFPSHNIPGEAHLPLVGKPSYLAVIQHWNILQSNVTTMYSVHQMDSEFMYCTQYLRNTKYTCNKVLGF